MNNWMIRTVRALTGHYNSARRFEKWARILTVVSLVISLFATVLTVAILTEGDPSMELRLAAVVAAAIAASLGLLQSQLDWGARAAEHLAAGTGYSKLRRLLETLDPQDPQILKSLEFLQIKHLYSEVSKAAPIIPKSQWKAAHDSYPKALETH